MLSSHHLMRINSHGGSRSWRWRKNTYSKVATFSTRRSVDDAVSVDIDGAWVFHRHGDRAPSVPLLTERQEEEAWLWRSKLPTEGAMREVSRRFPVQVHPSNGDRFLDADRHPYGYLTGRGMEQMVEAGEALAERWFTVDNNSSVLAPFDEITACSTHYLRTVTSVQCLLTGLLHSTSSSTSTSTSTSICDDYENEGLRQPPERVPLVVRNRASPNSLNAFDGDAEGMRRLVAGVVSHPDFREGDGEALPLATRLAECLPGLDQHGGTGGAKVNASVGAFATDETPSGINWIHAADHFVCRMAHGLPLANDPAVDDELRDMALPTLAHLAWRYRQWYRRSPRLLHAIAGPPLKEVVTELRRGDDPSTATTTDGLQQPLRRRNRPLRIYSCHDVTVLSLLYALDADLLHLNPNYWPSYATTLSIERVSDDGPAHQRRLRILLNGEMVRSNSVAEDPSNQDDSSMKVSDLSRLYDKLETEAVQQQMEEGR